MRSYYHRPNASERFTSGGPVSVSCLQCGATFETTMRKRAAGKAVYCSERRKDRHRNAEAARALKEAKDGRCCQHCGKAIPSGLRRDRKWCSDSCANKASRLRDPTMRFRSNLKKYGLTLPVYEEMLEKQNHGCAICGAPAKAKKRLAVDHCHETGKVRGLLCDNCNVAIGLLRHDPATISAAAAYLA